MSKCYIPEISIRTIRNEENMNIICQNNTNDSFNRLGFISKNLDKDADPNTSPFSLLIGLDDANNATVWNEQDGYIRFGTNNEERLRIFNNGDISCVNSHVELKHLTVHGDLNITNTKLGQTTRIDGGGDAAKIVAMNTDSLTFNIDVGGGDVKFIEMNHNSPQKIIFYKDCSMQKTLAVNGDISSNGKIISNGDISCNGTLYIPNIQSSSGLVINSVTASSKPLLSLQRSTTGNAFNKGCLLHLGAETVPGTTGNDVYSIGFGALNNALHPAASIGYEQVGTTNPNGYGNLVFSVKNNTTGNTAPADVLTIKHDKSSNFNGSVNIDSAAESNSTTTGALIVKGGAGIVGNVNVGNNMTLDSTTDSTTPSSGALVVKGGAGIGKNLYVGGDITINRPIINKATSTSNKIHTHFIYTDSTVAGWYGGLGLGFDGSKKNKVGIRSTGPGVSDSTDVYIDGETEITKKLIVKGEGVFKNNIKLSGGNNIIYMNSGGNASIASSESDGYIEFIVGGSLQHIMDSNGNVGIGTGFCKHNATDPNNTAVGHVHDSS